MIEQCAVETRGSESERTHRPQLARSALEQRVVHRERQARLAAATRGDGRARAQRVVEVGRVHLRALMRQAYAQPCRRIARATPYVGERAISWAILQADRLEIIVERSHVRRERESAQQRCVVDALTYSVGGRLSRTVHRQARRLASAHLEAPVAHHLALDEQPGRLGREWLQKVHPTQHRRSRCTRQLKVAHAREDGAAMHDVVGDERVQRARSGRVEDDTAVS